MAASSISEHYGELELRLDAVIENVDQKKSVDGVTKAAEEKREQLCSLQLTVPEVGNKTFY